MMKKSSLNRLGYITFPGQFFLSYFNYYISLIIKCDDLSPCRIVLEPFEILITVMIIKYINTCKFYTTKQLLSAEIFTILTRVLKNASLSFFSSSRRLCVPPLS